MNPRRNFLQKLAVPAMLFSFVRVSAWASAPVQESNQSAKVRAVLMGLDFKIIDAIYAGVKKKGRLLLAGILLLFSFILLVAEKSYAQETRSVTSARLNHIAVYVGDLDKSAKFYGNLFDLTLLEEPFKDGKHAWFSLGAAGQLHLIQGPVKKRKHDKNEHLCFSVGSVDQFITKLNEKKIDYSNWPGTAKAPTLRVDGVKQIYFQDPDGHWLEVNDAP